jgi:hypothetical protein
MPSLSISAQKRVSIIKDFITLMDFYTNFIEFKISFLHKNTKELTFT